MYLSLFLIHGLFPFEYAFIYNSLMQWGEKSFYEFSNRMCLLGSSVSLSEKEGKKLIKRMRHVKVF